MLHCAMILTLKINGDLHYHVSGLLERQRDLNALTLDHVFGQSHEHHMIATP